MEQNNGFPPGSGPRDRESEAGPGRIKRIVARVREEIADITERDPKLVDRILYVGVVLVLALSIYTMLN